ncbi:MAG: peptidylprolyl isomerase [Pseudomonadota bacterium]
MTNTLSNLSQRFSSVLRSQALIVRCGLATVSSRVMLRGVFMAALVGAMAMEAIRLGYVERPVSQTASIQSLADPIVASVGDEVVRVSDAVAHAAFIGVDEPQDVHALMDSGVVSDVADHLALAEAARGMGIANSRDIRAAVALAERQILAEAYLQAVIDEAVSEDAIRARYDAESEALARDNLLRLSRIVVPTRDEAADLAERALRSDFGTLARRHSIDEATKRNGGALGELRASQLDPALDAVASALPIGGVSAPFEIEAGWQIVRLDTRRAVRLPPYEERRAEIAATLRQEALAEAMRDARDQAPLRLRDPATVAMDQAEIAGTIALSVGQ